RRGGGLPAPRPVVADAVGAVGRRGVSVIGDTAPAGDTALVRVSACCGAASHRAAGSGTSGGTATSTSAAVSGRRGVGVEAVCLGALLLEGALLVLDLAAVFLRLGPAPLGGDLLLLRCLRFLLGLELGTLCLELLL